MEILKILNSMGNDYTAEMKCEHCGHIGLDTCGYHDSFYKNSVIPSMICAHCGKNADGTDKNRQYVNGKRVI